MKGWGDCGGKGAVFEILRAANGTQAGNAQLTASLHQVFAAGSDDLWVAQNLQAYGPEANWPEDARRFEEIRQILETIPTGREALRLKNVHRVGVQFLAGGGSYYDSSSNSMVIDSNHPPARAALSFVHELNHARYHHEGLSANIRTLSREEYIRQMVEEEAEGVIKSLEAKIELEGTPTDVSRFTYPLERQYREAYRVATDAARASNPEIAEDELRRIGREAGRQRVIRGFMDGEVQTSNTGEPYPDYYGRAWDRAHPTPTP
jgi:hypothetical protein